MVVLGDPHAADPTDLADLGIVVDHVEATEVKIVFGGHDAGQHLRIVPLVRFSFGELLRTAAGLEESLGEPSIRGLAHRVEAPVDDVEMCLFFSESGIGAHSRTSVLISARRRPVRGEAARPSMADAFLAGRALAPALAYLAAHFFGAFLGGFGALACLFGDDRRLFLGLGR